MLPININDIVKVKLTEKGKIRYEGYLVSVPCVINKVNENNILETELWDVAKIFGDMFYVGAEPIFENNEILIKGCENEC